MRNSERDNLMIDRYLRSELSEEEIIIFHQQLSQGGIFQEEYNLKKSIQDHFILESHRNNKQLLTKIEREEYGIVSTLKPTGQYSKNRRRRKLYLIASTAAAILLIITIIAPWSSSPSHVDLMFSNNFTAYPSSVIKRGSLVEENNTKIDAFVMYEMGEYKKCAHILEIIANQGETETYLYAGIAYLGINNYSKSLQLLNEYKNSTSSHPEIPNLYIAINKLMMGETSVAVEELTELSARTDFIGKQAKLFLKEIQ